MARKSKRGRLSVASCPDCGGQGGLKRILYGMPGPDFDHDKFMLGGCVISGSDPEIGCSRCDWYGYRKDLKAE
jgi:hypothetical protein